MFSQSSFDIETRVESYGSLYGKENGMKQISLTEIRILDSPNSKQQHL